MLQNPQLILASASPRRKELLETLSIPFQILYADIDESLREKESPSDYVKRLAFEKASWIAKDLLAEDNYFVLGADTSVVIGNKILGKPKDKQEAFKHLSLLQGETHEVFTGVCLIRAPDTVALLEVYRSAVTMKKLSDEQIKEYIATGEPMDKAGSYAAQGLGKELIQKIEGSLTNVIGLPVEVLEEPFRMIGFLR